MTTTRESGEARSAITRVIGPVPAPSSTRVRARDQSTFRTVRRDSHGLLGATLAIAVPCLRNLPRNSVKSLISWFAARRAQGAPAEFPE